EAQRRDARGIGFVREHDDATEDHFIEGIRREWLAHEERLAAGDGEIDRRERAGPPARADERRAAAVDDVNRPAGYAAARCGGRVCDDVSPVEDVRSLAPHTR